MKQFKNSFMKQKYFSCISFFLILIFSGDAKAQLGTEQKIFTRADTLRGSISAERAWWDVNWQPHAD